MTMNQRTVRKQLSQGLPTVCLPFIRSACQSTEKCIPLGSCISGGEENPTLEELGGGQVAESWGTDMGHRTCAVHGRC